jgi:hypothetical protein
VVATPDDDLGAAIREQRRIRAPLSRAANSLRAGSSAPTISTAVIRSVFGFTPTPKGVPAEPMPDDQGVARILKF